ncbi:MAG: hypothetical protein ABIV43_01620, partial [Candidatus Saccharimonadales bacterium]
PHVDSIAERVQIDGEPLSEAEFCAELTEFLGLVEQAAQPPSYFELLYAFSLWVFDRRSVDYAVIETGMGGLHDATNVARRPDKLCIITDIGYDHMQILGNTLPEIAGQKIGIVHAGNTALTYRQADDVMNVFDAWCNKVGATLTPLDASAISSNYNHEFGGLPLFQQRNWLLAREAYNWIADRDGLADLSLEDELRTHRLQVPARMEILRRGDKVLVMDGAHNQQKMTAFVESFHQQFPDVRPDVLVALKTGKEYSAVAPMLATLASNIIVTTFDTSQDLPAVSLDPELLASELQAAGASSVQVVPDLRMAYDSLMKTSNNVCIITGSFYLISQLRQQRILL